MIDPENPVVVFGAGSIGERHLGILQKLGYSNLWVYRQRALPLRIIDSQHIQVFTDLDLLDKINPQAAIICTPTAQHLVQTKLCLEKQIPVLVEKPLSHTTEGINELKDIVRSNQAYIQVAYMLRYHPFFQKIKSLTQSNEWGRLLSAQSYWGEYLPDWHPWEDYRQSYAARKELGGGAALTLSHDIDLINWIAGSAVKSWNTLKNFSAPLELDVESGSDISLAYDSGLTAHCHLNFHERFPRRTYRFVWEKGSIEIDYFKSCGWFFGPGTESTEWKLPDFDRNQLFEAQTKDFFQRINTGNFAENSVKALDESEVIIKICS
ncbi:Gfo/Idh/MocA family protein [Arundinibacter roseus]|uniref:Gfo/Idh/MocA family oxidoreductase n=1 Tax=Arundinibacter roseus TaxID=2070510 RepID=A0A4R4K9Z2_9BACT|nr:Gfo/Idh/MocA family oxidoreductase [Arundinibacter roseus]TDB63462.1 Gfo/Idh/MocA family oxidoreductase [Arundinibacter roseus]